MAASDALDGVLAVRVLNVVTPWQSAVDPTARPSHHSPRGVNTAQITPHHFLAIAHRPSPSLLR